MKSRARVLTATAMTAASLLMAGPALAMPSTIVRDGGGAGGGGTGGGSVAAAPYQFVPLTLRCDQTEDSGEDEAYLTFSAKGRVWGQDMNEGDPDSTVSLDQLSNLYFGGSAEVRLYDEDTGFLDEDDLLGSLTVTGDMADGADRMAHFDQDGASYWLSYRIVKR